MNANEVRETNAQAPAEQKKAYDPPAFQSHDPLDSVTTTVYYYTFTN